MPSRSGDTLSELVALMPSPAVAHQWRNYVAQHVRPFSDVLRSLPQPGPGSISTAEAFWLFRLVAELQPSVVVDSGSATGWSAFVMAAAAPEAVVHCFDPYCCPESLPRSAIYHDRDWTRVRLDLPAGAIAFFDDHVNQRRRALQSQRAGITHVVFHDVYRVKTKSTISVAFADLVGLAEICHVFEPLWFDNPIFMDTSQNTQMYRWLTWLQLASPPGLRLGPRLRAVAERRLLRNPSADESSRLNWWARR